MWEHLKPHLPPLDPPLHARAGTIGLELADSAAHEAVTTSAGLHHHKFTGLITNQFTSADLVNGSVKELGNKSIMNTTWKSSLKFNEMYCTTTSCRRVLIESTEIGFAKSVQILLSKTQAGPGRAVKQEQEEIAPNHVQAF